jgi:hypothetical protein
MTYLRGRRRYRRDDQERQFFPESIFYSHPRCLTYELINA